MPKFERSSKRHAQLVSVAKVILQERGFAHTTLPEVAAQAQLSSEHVRAHFAGSAELIEAVLLDYEREGAALLDVWSATHAEPRPRLHCLVRAPLDRAALPMLFGGPHDNLCKELASHAPGTALGDAAARKITMYLDWAAAQFRASGRPNRQARALAEQLMCSLQGALLIADAMQPEELSIQLRRIERWLDHVLDMPTG